MPTDNSSTWDTAGRFGQSATSAAETAPIQLSQAATAIGNVSSLTGQTTILRATGETVQASIGTPVFQNDTFETASGSGVGLSFNDGSSFSLGSDARLTIDEFVYAGGGGDSNMVMNLAQGAFSFVSGQVAKTGDNNMTIVTPTATIGIRGTAGAGDDDEVVLLQEPGQQTGELIVTTQGGTVSLTTPNAYTNTSNPFAPPTPPVQRPLGDIQSRFGGALRQLPVQLPANQNLPSGNDTNGDQGGDAGEEGQGGETDTAEGEGEEDGEEGGEEEGGDGETAEGEEIGEEGEGEEETDTAEEEGGEGEGEGENAEGEGNGDNPFQVTGGQDGTGLAPPPAPPPTPNTSVLPPQPKPVTKPQQQSQPQDPEPVITGGGSGGGDPANVISVTANSTVTVTAGVDRIEISGAGVQATVVGTLQGGDSIVDASGSSGQVASITDVTNHTFTVNGIESVLFGNMSGSELQNVTVAGTGTVIFNTNSGPFNANIFGDGANNTFNIGVGISANSTVGASMGGGVDTVNVNTGFEVTLSLANVEFVGSTIGGQQAVVLGNAVSGVSFDFGNLGDADTLTLFNGTNNITVSDIQTVNGGSGNDTVVAGSTTLQTLSLGAGTDTVVASGLANFSVTALVNVENFVGSVGVDNVGLASGLTSGSVYDGGGSGADTLTLFSGSTNTASITNFRNIMGTASSEFLALETAMSSSFNTIVNLGGSTLDQLILLSAGGNTVSVENTETITGSGGADTLILRDFAASDIDLGTGSDVVELDAGAGTYTFFVFDGIETANGLFGTTETVNLTGIGLGLSGTLFNLGGLADGDTVLLGNQANSVAITTLANLTSGTGNDAVILTAATAGSIDLGAGSDTVTATTAVTVSSLSNVENYTGSNGADILTLATLLNSGDDYNGQVDGDGDVLNLAAGINQATIDHFETINGTASNDQLTLESQIFAGFGTTVDLLAGIDTLNLSNTDNSLIVNNVEFLNAGTGNDSIFLGTDLLTGSQYDGGAGGTDNLILLDDSTNNAVIGNFEQISGNSTSGITLFFEAGSQVNTTFTFSGAGTDTLHINDAGSSAILNGVEVVFGGTGNDTVTVNDNTGVEFHLGDGGDTATGAVSVADVFHYAAQSDADIAEGETITNFEIGTDLIDVSLLAGGSFAFIGGAAFTSASGSLEGRFADANTIEFDVNDDGTADMEITLSNGIAGGLSSADFVDVAIGN